LVATLAVVLLSGGAFGLHRFLTRSKHFAVAEVRFSSLEHADLDTLRMRSGVVPGENLLSIDLAAVERRVAADPWVRRVHARRELPATLCIDVEERKPALTASLGGLYLVDELGNAFRRADPADAAQLPLVTGVGRDEYSADPERAHSRLRDAVALAAVWSQSATRPPLGEIHLERGGAVTVYTAGGVGVRLGRTDNPGQLVERLTRFDRVWVALAASHEQARFIYVDNRARPDRVTVKLAGRQS
jgi:cell division protein FtsQ